MEEGGFLAGTGQAGVSSTGPSVRIRPGRAVWGSPHGVAGKIGSESLPVSGARMPGCWTVPVQRHLRGFR